MKMKGRQGKILRNTDVKKSQLLEKKEQMMGKKYQEESKGWDRNSRNTIRSKIKKRYDRLKPMNTGGKTA